MDPVTISKQRVEQIVLNAIRTTNLAREPENRVAESADAALYGGGSPLDSLGLVSLVIEVEEMLRDEGLDVTLSDERAMSQKRSPFRSVPMLVEYICSLQESNSP